MDALDEFLARPDQDLKAFVEGQRAHLAPDVVRRSRRVAAVLVEPIQGEGGVRRASARFMRKLRLLTKIYDVPLIFDEVQTGWGMTGRLWAHEFFDLPCPPDVVTWAKKAQNGVLFVSEELATFFQEEKKFNTTWEGDSVGMVRLLALLDKLDLDQVQRTGERAKQGLVALARDYREILKNVRGAGVMLAFDVQRADWRDALRDRAFRRGLVLLPAGERVLRFYPRYDTEPSAIDEALAILRLAIEDLVGGRVASEPTTAVEMRVGTLAIPLDTLEVVELTRANFETHKLQILAVEQERYGAAAKYPPDVLRAGRRPLLQFPLETLETTASNVRAIGIALRDRVSSRFVAYALGSSLEDHDEEGVHADPHFGENNTFYLQAMATSPTVQNDDRARELPAGFAANARDRGRVRVPLDLDRGAAARHESVVVPRRRCLEPNRELPAQRHVVRLPAGRADAFECSGCRISRAVGLSRPRLRAVLSFQLCQRSILLPVNPLLSRFSSMSMLSGEIITNANRTRRTPRRESVSAPAATVGPRCAAPSTKRTSWRSRRRSAHTVAPRV